MQSEEPYYQQKIFLSGQIRKLFLTKWAGQWVAERELKGQNRLWQRVFNDLVKQGFIEKNKDGVLNRYKWVEKHDA